MISVPDSQEPTTEQVLLLRYDLKSQEGRNQNEQNPKGEVRNTLVASRYGNLS